MLQAGELDELNRELAERRLAERVKDFHLTLQYSEGRVSQVLKELCSRWLSSCEMSICMLVQVAPVSHGLAVQLHESI